MNTQRYEKLYLELNPGSKPAKAPALPRLSSGSSRYGAQMGRSDSLPAGPFSGKFRLVQLRMVDGDYDEGGAYWGGVAGSYMFRALADDECALRYDETGRPEVFTRAPDRATAKAAVCKLIPGATFYR